MTKKLTYLLTLSFVCLTGLACSERGGDSPPPMMDADLPMMDASPDADASLPNQANVGSGTDSLELRVIVGASFDDVSAVGARVYLDDGAGGDRVLAVAGTDGVVRFDDCTLEGAAVVAYLDEDHSLASVGSLSSAAVMGLIDEGYSDSEGRLTISLSERVSRRDVVTLSGTIEGRMGQDLFVGALLSGVQSHSGAGGSYSISVPREEAFQLLAIDIGRPEERTISMRGTELVFNSWSIQAREAQNADETFDFSFEGTSVTPTEFRNGGFTLPMGEFFAEARPRMYLLDARSLNIIGYSSRVDVNAAGTAVEFRGEYLEGVMGVSAYLGVYAFNDGPVGSQVIRSGVPTAGLMELSFLNPPDVVRPVFGMVQLVGDSIEWRSDEPVGAYINLRDDDDDLMWRHIVAPGVTQTVLPAVPADVDRSTYFASAELDAVISLCADYGRLCGRSANGRGFGVLVR